MSSRERRAKTKRRQRATNRARLAVSGAIASTAVFGLAGPELSTAGAFSFTTSQVKDINPGAGDSDPKQLAEVDGTLYFVADDGTHGYQLWKSDGTTTGTSAVDDISAGPEGPHYLTNVNGTLYFEANDGTQGYQLWKSNGTAATTSMITDINAASSKGFQPKYLTNVNGTLYFTANDGTHGYQLWKSDGSTTGTEIVDEIGSGAPGTGPAHVTNVAGTLYFSANDGTHGDELWKSNAAGTSMVDDIRPGSSGSNPYSLTNVAGTLFFTANDGTHGNEVWKATATGATMVDDINQGSASSDPGNLTNVNGTLYFEANDGTDGYQLWKSDGTSGGTIKLTHLNAPNGFYPSNLVNANGTLFFSGNDGTHGYELWKSGGTTPTTVEVADINPGAASSSPQELTFVDDTLFFRANDGTHGRELWKSDGTSTGTVEVADIDPGAVDSYPSHLTNVGGTLFFSARDNTHGYELWKATVIPDPTTTSVVCSPSSVTARTPTTCKVTVTDTAATDAVAPAGTISVGSSSLAGAFGGAGKCTLVATTGSTSSCALSFTPTAAGTYKLTAAYSGELFHVGSSGSASVQSHAPPPPKLKLGKLKVHGTTLYVPVSCTGAATTTCSISATLSVSETLRGHSVIAISASGKRTKRQLTVASATVKLKAGKMVTLKLRLRSPGLKLLAHFGKLPAKVTIKLSGKIVASRTVRFQAAAKKHHR